MTMQTGSKNRSAPVSPGEAGGDDVLLAVKKSYQCSTCARQFSRPDHLRRHALSRVIVCGITTITAERGATARSPKAAREAGVGALAQRSVHSSRCGHDSMSFPVDTEPSAQRRSCDAKVARPVMAVGGGIWPATPPESLDRNGRQVPRLDEEGAADDSQTADLASDARSIKALLDNGTQSFTEKFNLPFFHDETGDVGAPLQAPRANPSLDYEGLADFESQLHFSLGPSEGFELLLNSVSDFWTGPFGTTQPWVNDVDEGDLVWLVRENVPNMFQQPALGQERKAETPQITALRDVLLRTAQQLHLHPSSLDEMTAIIGFLCCQPKIDAFVGLFFLNWHPNGPVLHPPSFDTELVPTELLISVIALGAMYSQDKADRLAARKLLNIAELVIFSAEVFSAAHEIKHASDESIHNELDWHQFQQIQAGYLITTVQYWAGTRQAKSRAMETRFCELVKVVLTAQPYQQRAGS
ncbi:hypothetical protein VCV18_004732 [Metarhizium anisopliae]